MKNKGVIISLFIILMISAPIVYADNFLSGYSILDGVSNFFNNAYNIVKGFIIGEKVGGPQRNYVCDPGEEINCQTGLPGICSAGTQTCNKLGTAFEQCIPNVQPGERDEILDNGIDDNCDGKNDEIDGELFICINGERKCGTDNQCSNGECVIECQNNIWVEVLFCTESCLNGECTLGGNEFPIVEAPTYNLQIIIDPSNGGIVSPLSGEKNKGEELTLTATENDEFEFSNWETHGSVNLNPDQLDDNPLTINNPQNDITLTANFEAKKYFLNVEYQEGGSVSRSIPEPEEGYNKNTVVTLTATASQFYEFVGWEGDTSESGNPITITMNSDKTITAVFQIIYEDCDNNLDDDGDGLIDNLDPDCNDDSNGLKIINIVKSGNEFYQHSNDLIVGCSYEINPARTFPQVSPCVKLTLDDSELTCQKDPQANSIEFKNCELNEAGQNKILSCSVLETCNGLDPQSQFTHLNITKFTTCEFGQESPELISILDIISPNNNEEFEAGDEINIEARIKNSYGEDADFSTMASLIDDGWNEVEISEESTEEITFLTEKTFELNLTIPEDLDEGDYKLYVKAYLDGDEEEVCRSTGITLQIQGISDDEDCIDIDDDNFCSNRECDDNNPSVHPGAIEICTDGIDNDCDGLTDYADSSCETIPLQERPEDDGSGSGRQGEDLTDSDNDGLPDYWEYNYFGNLEQRPNDDFDNDGISNIDEYVGNTNPKIPNKKSSVIWIVLLIILIVGIIAGGTYFIIKRIKNKPKRINISATSYSMDNNNQSKLQQFIQQAKSQGMNKQQIKNALLNAGWKEQDINKLL
jgi:hypothetical protein